MISFMTGAVPVRVRPAVAPGRTGAGPVRRCASAGARRGWGSAGDVDRQLRLRRAGRVVAGPAHHQGRAEAARAHPCAVPWPQAARHARHASRRMQSSWDVETTTTVLALQYLARRLCALTVEAAEHEKAIRAIVQSWRPNVLEEFGWVRSLLRRCCVPGRTALGSTLRPRSRCLPGVAPIPANSGQVTNRCRLSRYGDRQLSRALHIIVQSRIRYDGPTRDYVARRTTEGKTGREIKRCLSRYIARDLYRLLEPGPVSA
jgi:hypothetical protein